MKENKFSIGYGNKKVTMSRPNVLVLHKHETHVIALKYCDNKSRACNAGYDTWQHRAFVSVYMTKVSRPIYITIRSHSCRNNPHFPVLVSHFNKVVLLRKFFGKYIIEVTLQCIPAHCDIGDKENADSLATKGSNNTHNTQTHTTSIFLYSAKTHFH